jgi:predicted enzyme related to lactoylglutathione lyase
VTSASLTVLRLLELVTPIPGIIMDGHVFVPSRFEVSLIPDRMKKCAKRSPMASIANITFAADNPRRLADFWVAAVGYQRQEPPPGFIEAWVAAGRDPDAADAAVDPAGTGPRLFFRRMERNPEAPMAIHLDLHADVPDAEVRRLEGLGATVVARKELVTGDWTERWTVMADPEGNRFCVQ